MKKKRKIAKKSQSSIDSTFFTTFIGEYVEIICSRGVNYHGNTVPVALQGYLLDVDEEFYYLSKDGQSVNSAVKKTDLTVIEIINENTVIDEMLNQVHMPENPEDGN